MPKNVDHVVVSYNTQPPVFLCTRCGDSEALELPVRMARLSKLCRAFTLKHEDCPAQPARKAVE